MIETLNGGRAHPFAVLDGWVRKAGRLFNNPIDSLVTRAVSLRASRANLVSIILLNNVTVLV
jgi:hypothetical protein